MINKITLWLAFFVVFVSFSAHANTGGPDAFGYSWIDSKSPSPIISYDWIEISDSGTNTGVRGYGSYRSIPVGFEFEYYGIKYNSVRVNANGYLTFGPYGSYSSNTYIPNNTGLNNFIAPFWDYLYVYNNCFYKTIGEAPNRILVVQYNNVRTSSGGDSLTFQALLHENGKIVFQYKSLSGGSRSDGSTATVGIEDETGKTGIQYSLNQSTLSGTLAIAFVERMNVYQVAPMEDANAVPRNTRILVRFNQPIDTASMANAISVAGSVSGDVAGTVIAVPELESIEFIPDNDFAPDELLTVTVSSSVKGVSGQELSTDYQWSFHTGSVVDDLAPAAVTGLNAADVPGDGGGRIELAWSPVDDDDLAYYKVYRATSPTSSLAEATLVTRTKATGLVDSSPNDNVEYYYAIVAMDTNGNISEHSFTGPVVSIDDIPDTPSGLRSSNSNNGIYLYWDQNTEPDFAGYRIYYGTSSANYENHVDVGNVTTFTLTGLTVCQNYFVAISAYDTGGNESPISYETYKNFGSPGAPAVPTGLQSTSSEGVIELTWDANQECDFQYYYLYRSESRDSGYSYIKGIYKTHPKVYQDEKIADGVTYYYNLVAKDIYGAVSDYSDPVSSVAVNNIAPNAPNITGKRYYLNGLNVSWSGNNNYVYDIAGFKVHYGTSSQNYDQVKIVSTTSSSYSTTLTGLQDCTDYYIAVSTFDLSGNESGLSQEQVYNSGQAGYPTPPTNLQTVSEESKITLTWEASVDCDINYYYVYRSENGSGDSYIGRTTGTNFIDERIADGVTYSYKLRTYDFSWNTREYSETVSAVAINTTPPSVPQNVRSVFYSNHNSIYVYWSGTSDPDRAHYKIVYGTASGEYTAEKTTTSTGSHIYGLEGCTPYYFAVQTVDLSGNESELSEETTTVFNGSSSIAMPSGFSSSSAESAINLTWEPNAECGIRGYKIYRSTTSGSGFQLIGTIYNQTAFQDDSLADGTRYYYHIKAFNYVGTTGPASAEVSEVAIDTMVPQAPSYLYVGGGESYVDVSWNASSSPDVKEYIVYYGTQDGEYGSYQTTTNRSYRIAGLEGCQTYYVAVKAVDFSGHESPLSVEMSAATYLLGTPVPPVSVSVTLDHAAAQIEWQPNVECDIRNYYIYRSLTHGAGYQHVGSASGTTYRDSNIAGDTTYYYIVKAVDSQGLVSDGSIEVSIITNDLVPPEQPTVDADLLLYTQGSQFVLRGIKEADSSLIVNGTELVPVTGETTWEVVVDLSSVQNDFELSSADQYGNICEPVTVTVYRDSDAPLFGFTDPALDSRVNEINSISVELSDPGDGAGVDLQNSLQGATVKDASGSVVAGVWQIVDNRLMFIPAQGVVVAEGEMLVQITAVDILGNSQLLSLNFNYDLSPPVANALSLTPDSPYRAETVAFELTFSEAMDLSVPAEVGMADEDLRTYDLAGHWQNTTTWRGSYTFSSATGDGQYAVSVSGARDAAGNVMTAQEIGTFVLDTVPPSAPMVDEAPQPTTAASVVLSGTKEAASRLFINNQELTEFFAATTWNKSVALNEGINTFTLTATDLADNQSGSTAVAVLRDFTAPVIASSTPEFNAQVSSAATINIVLADTYSEVDLVSSVTGAVIRESSGGTVNGTWTASVGTLVFTPEATLNEGTYSILLYPVDSLGNVGTTAFSFTLDSSVPSASALNMTPNSPHKAEAVNFRVDFDETMDISVDPVVTLTKPNLLIDTVIVLTGDWAGTSVWSGSYTFAADTGDGVYSVSVSGAKDLAGNLMAEQPVGSFVLDTQAPAEPSINGVTSPTRLATQILTGSKPADTALLINGVVKVPLGPDTDWSLNYPLREGENVLDLVARDAAGNESTAVAAAVILDNIPPTFTVDSYQTQSASAVQTLSGTKEPGCAVTLNGTLIISADDQSNSWSHEVTLPAGVVTRHVFVAADSIGNLTSRTIDLIYDADAPPALAAGVLQADGAGRGTEVKLSWPAYPEPQDLAYYRVFVSETDFSDITGLTAAGTAERSGKAFTVTGLTEGTTYFFAVEPVDTSGNSESVVSTTTAIPVDAVAPEEVSGLSATAAYSVTDGNSVTLSWTASSDSRGDLAEQVLYVDSGSGYDAGIVLDKALTSYTVGSLSDATVYKFRLAVRDAAGHESAGTVVEAVTRLANPAVLTVETGKNQISLHWDGVSSPYMNYYKIYRLQSTATQSDVSAMAAIAAQDGTGYLDTGLLNGVTYQYAVTVVNSSGAENTLFESVSGKPRQDADGPVIGTFSLAAGQVVSAPLTVEVTASDAESAMDKIELYTDDVLVATGSDGSVSYYWNLIESTDGNHTIKVVAVDSLGNATEEARNVVVSLAPPTTPAITAHVTENTTPTTVIGTSGTAPLFTTVTLKLNGAVVDQTQTSASGTFNFTGLNLVEGENLLSVKATHRGGDSPYSAAYKIVVDTGAPSAPLELVAKALAGGSVQFSWRNGAGELPTGYNLYASAQPFTALGETGVSRVNSSPIGYSFKEIIPADDTLNYYAVTALDGAGNESGLSSLVEIASDRSTPQVTEILFTQNAESITSSVPCGPGLNEVILTVSEPLAEKPFFSLEPQIGSPIVVSLTEVDALHYSGSFRVDATSPHGPLTWKFSGKDAIGNRGSAQGAGPLLDVRGPIATITAPVQLTQLGATVDVEVQFNEPPAGLPIIEFTDVSGTTVPVIGLLQGSDELHWNGSLDLSALAEGEGRFRLVEARDGFGNFGTTVAGGENLLLYQDAPPAPAVPQGLTVEAQMGGKIVLLWKAVTGADSYNLYRRAVGETDFTLLVAQSATAYTDLPETDGDYEYAVSSIGLLDSESGLSAAVKATADRSAPNVPTELALVLEGAGVKATWQAAATSDAPASYRLYRAAAPITGVAGLTAVASAEVLEAIDGSPSTGQRHYAVTALDALGNESSPSASVEIDFPVAPVKNLVLTQLESGKPQLTWQAADSGVTGYWIYRNGQKVNADPTPGTFYIDGYYASGTVTYGIAAIDLYGDESPIREVVLPELDIALPEGTTLRRGLLETIPVVLSASNESTVKELVIKVGSAAESTLAGPFPLTPGTPVTVQKVAATPLDALDTVALVGTAELQPDPSTTVLITRTMTAQVAGSGTALEIFNEPLIRGTNASVRLKINNLGSARMEFLTSRNNGSTAEVIVYLKDQDGNVLAQGRLDQRTGSQIVNSDGYATARVEPGDSFLSEPIVFKVPENAPYAVVLEAVIGNTYYHYAQSDQVRASGLSRAIESRVAEVSYSARAQAEKDTYLQGEPVMISGQALSTVDGNPMPYVLVRLGLSVQGFDRFVDLTTDGNGQFSYIFNPASNEAGSFSLWAVHPDLSDRSVQDRFELLAMTVSPNLFSLKLAKGSFYDIPVVLKNYSGAELTGLTFDTSVSDGLVALLLNAGSDQLAGNETRNLKLRVTATDNAPTTGYVTMTVNTEQGLSGQINVNADIFDNVPIISSEPSYVDTGLMRGTQRMESIELKNAGLEILQNARIEGPSTEWMTLLVDRSIGSLAVGQSATVALLFKPGDTIPPGIYNDRLTIIADNHIPYTVNLQATVTSNAIGSVMFDVLNELIEDVAGATITLQHQNLPELLYTLKTGSDGTVIKNDIPEGRYSYSVSATGHKTYGGSFSVLPGLTVSVPVALEVVLVEVEWSVTPVVIEDRYEIKITQTFETNVPTSVLIVEPPGVNLPAMEFGEVYNGEFTITNYGLISADFKGLDFPTSFDGYDMEVLGNIPLTLGAMEKIVIPYRITRRVQE